VQSCGLCGPPIKDRQERTSRTVSRGRRQVQAAVIIKLIVNSPRRPRPGMTID
jgi:hypothetical protein